MYVYRLANWIDDFGSFVPLNRWSTSPEDTAWALAAVLALADAAETLHWQGDMRHLPAVGVLASGVPFLIVKQNSDGLTFIITEADHEQIEAAVRPHGAYAFPAGNRLTAQVPTRAIGVREPGEDRIHDDRAR